MTDVDARRTLTARERATKVAMYIGAGMGPLGGTVVSPMLPNIAHSLHSTTSGAATSLTAYFVPFAAAQLVSGTLGERWGRRRTARLAFLAYALGALICAIAPNLTLFMIARVAMGTANAFTTPLLLAALADLVPAARLSRAVGLFSSCLAAGQSFAPLVGGLAAARGWQWAFVVVAVVALALATLPPAGDPRPGVDAPPFRRLFTPTIGFLSLGAFMSYFGASSIPFLVALYAENQLHIGQSSTGALLLGFGLAGLLLGTLWGRLTDRFGAVPCGVIATAVTAVFVALVGFSHGPAQLALLWTLAGCGASMIVVVIQNLTVRTQPDNRAGALSVVSALRFSGAALSPVLLLPIYTHTPSGAFLTAAIAVLITAPSLLLMPRPNTSTRPALLKESA
ncbi:MFS transporter [Nocardia sp. NPDC056000]|uniref:MFS transporter n=1 Tax=Nocardia sp. NPDC056000 TaxID=3345674 RepID=UPI0035D66DBC